MGQGGEKQPSNHDSPCQHPSQLLERKLFLPGDLLYLFLGQKKVEN